MTSFSPGLAAQQRAALKPGSSQRFTAVPGEPMWRLALSPHAVIMAVLFAGALALGYVLLPGEAERIAMLERDGHKAEALNLLEKSYEAGDRSQRVIFQLQEYYLFAGNLAKARSMLEQLAKERPRDAQVQLRLAEFYRDTQDEDAYIQALDRRIALKYSESACKEVIGLRRRRGEYALELATIERCRVAGYRRAEDIVRLSSLLAADKNLPAAANLLRSVDDLRRLRTDRERMELFSYLLALDQPGDAIRRATRWLKASRDEAFGLQLIDTLVDQNKHDVALRLARDVGTPGSSVALAVAELMIDRGEAQAARSYLEGWLAYAQSAATELCSRFVNASLDADDAALAFKGAQKLGLDGLNQSDLSALAIALLSGRQNESYGIIQPLLSAETISSDPLLGAAIALKLGTGQLDQPEPGQVETAGSVTAARALLAKVSIAELDAWRLTLWANLTEGSGGNKEAASAALRRAAEVRARTPAYGKQASIIRRLNRTAQLRPRKAPVDPQFQSTVGSPNATAPATKAKGGKSSSESILPFGFNIFGPATPQPQTGPVTKKPPE